MTNTHKFLFTVLLLAALSAIFYWTFVRFSGSEYDSDVNASISEWTSYGLTPGETRFSDLEQINRRNVTTLGLAWSKQLGTRFSLQATPLMIDGTLYFTGDFSQVFAVDARTGETLWNYTPEFDRSYLRRSTYGTANRGVAHRNGKIFVGTLNGELHALDMKSGQLIWKVNTIGETESSYTITGAPRIADNLVLIGNAGAEFGVRGFVSAYDAETGKLRWRFYTVPGNPNKPFEHPDLAEARKTWTGDRWWKFGGGGTVWNSIVYDPDTHLVFLGVGNGSPLARKIRSPEGGDNLYLSSIVALDARTGKKQWHYQTTPGDTWDYTATQDIILTKMEIDGSKRDVVLQAPKNGFFYVLDRRTGELLRAHNYVKTTWASHVDMNTGRPVENPETDFSDKAQRVYPGPLGGHNWQAMAFDADRGLAFIPAMENSAIFALDPGFKKTGKYERDPVGLNIGFGAGDTSHIKDVEPGYGKLQAFDPVTGEIKWSVRHDHYFNGGVLATAGDLVFQGDAFGEFAAYDADNGNKLWAFDSYRSVVAPPITYALDGVQYIALLTATGGGEHYAGYVRDTAVIKYGNSGQLLVFKLNGAETLEEPPLTSRAIPEKPKLSASSAELAQGNIAYHTYCAHCHGANVKSAGIFPDLRMMPMNKHQAFKNIVSDGLLSTNGMASFADVLSKNEVDHIEQFIIYRSNEDR